MNKGPERAIDSLPVFLSLLAVGIGAGLQLALVLGADFPLNDGGMLFVMAKDLSANGYRLPAFTTYNYAQIPFAYPPLPIYWAALLHDGLGISLFELLRWLPWIFCTLSIPAFGLLSLTILQSRRRAALAMLAFALFLPTFNRTLMGGGLSRAPGLLFALLALNWIQHMYAEHSRRYVLPAVIFSALTVLSHSVYAWFVIYTAGVIFLLSRPEQRDVFNSLLVALGVLVLVSPWLVAVVAQHGLAPLLAALQTRGTLPLIVTIGQLLFFYNLSHEMFIDLLGVTAVFGLVLSFIEGRLLFAFWLLAIFLFERTSPAHLSFIPLAMLAGMAVEKLAFGNSLATTRRGRRILLAAFNYLLFVAVVSAYLSSSISFLTTQERQGMQWAATNADPGSYFVVLSGKNWWEDPLSEWFPALAERVAVNTVQGSEWFSGEIFYEHIQNYDRLRQCLADARVVCLDEWAQSAGKTFEYVFISLEDEKAVVASSLVKELRASGEYAIVFERDGVIVWQRLFQ
jgi:hypothetical protein